MRRAFRFLEGALLGAAVGAVVGLFMAPATGEEFRQKVARWAADIQQEIRQAAEERRAELEAELNRLRGEAA